MAKSWRNDSVICDYTDGAYCFLSDNTKDLEVHHIMNGSLRKWADEQGLWVYLNHYVHMYLHNTIEGKQKAIELKALAQRVYEQNHSHDEWMKKVRKNYL